MGDITINEHRLNVERFTGLHQTYPKGEYNGTLSTLWFQLNVEINGVDVECTWFLDNWHCSVKNWLLENHQDTWAHWDSGLIMKYDAAIEPTTGEWSEEE